ncbi:MAG: ribosomal protein S18-alanine N-acetyltransferase [Thermofilaceae archaeon]
MAGNSPSRTIERLIIREAKVDDLDTIHSIELKCFGQDAYGLALLQIYQVISLNTFLVAEYEGAVVGYVIGTLEARGEGHVVSIGVHPNYRRKGVATALLNEVINRFNARGVRIVKLEVRVSNFPAINLYRKLGFEITGIVEKYYSDGEDAYMMVKSL